MAKKILSRGQGRKKCILVLSLLIFFLTTSYVQANTVFFWADECGDDYGPGHYVYPRHQHFQEEKGLWDLRFFVVEDKDDFYYFHFSFQSLPDPWSGFFGFSHPLIHLYIDNAPGGEERPLEPLGELRMHPTSLWNKALIICGGWVQGVREGEIWDSPEFQVSWDRPKPSCLAGSTISVGETTIIVGVPKEWLASLEGAKYYVLVGGYDPLEAGHFRQVQEEASLWCFGGAKANEYNPPILDILVPVGISQKEILNQKIIVLRPIGPAGRLAFSEFLIFLGSFSIFLLTLFLAFKIKEFYNLGKEGQELGLREQMTLQRQ